MSELSSIAAAQFEIGLPNEAVETLTEVPRIASPSSAYAAGTALRSLGEAQAKVGLRAEAGVSFDQALEVLSSENDKGLRASGSRRVAEAQVRASMRANVALSQALRAAQGMTDGRVHASTLASIAEIQVKAEQTEEARHTFDEALKVAESVAHLATRNETLRFIAGRFVEAGMKASAREALEQALQVALAITHAAQRFSALSQTGEAFAMLGDTAKAAGIFVHTLEAAKRTGRAHALLSVARAQAQAGLLSDAVSSLREAPASPTLAEGPMQPLNRNDQQRVTTHNQDSYNLGRVQILLNIAEQAIALGSERSAEDRFKEALQFARSIRNADMRAPALWSIAQGMLSGGAPLDHEVADEAVAALDADFSRFKKTEQSAQGRIVVGDPDSRIAGIAGMFAAIGQAQARSGATTKAAATFDRATRTRSAALDYISQSNILRIVATAQAASGLIAAALRTVQDIEFPIERAKALLSVAEAVSN